MSLHVLSHLHSAVSGAERLQPYLMVAQPCGHPIARALSIQTRLPAIGNSDFKDNPQLRLVNWYFLKAFLANDFAYRFMPAQHLQAVDVRSSITLPLPKLLVQNANKLAASRPSFMKVLSDFA